MLYWLILMDYTIVVFLSISVQVLGELVGRALRLAAFMGRNSMCSKLSTSINSSN